MVSLSSATKVSPHRSRAFPEFRGFDALTFVLGKITGFARADSIRKTWKVIATGLFIYSYF